MCSLLSLVLSVACTAAKCSDQSNFVPFIIETGGRISAAGLEFFDNNVSGALAGDTVQARAGRHAAVRGVTAALVRQQGYLLAQIVTGDPRA